MSIRAISDLLLDFKSALPGGAISVAHILEAFHERGFGFLLFLFAMPMALPLPVPPGINVLFATPLLILTAQQAVGRHTIWLPRRLTQKTIATDKLTGMIDAALPWLKRLELLIRPRLGFMTRGISSNLIGLIGLVMALTACIPLPLTNTVPSLAVALMAVGVIMRDGLAVLAGAAIGMIWVGLLGYFAVTFGLEGIEYLKETIKTLI